MENCGVPVLPTDNRTGWRVSSRERRLSTGRQCPCCTEQEIEIKSLFIEGDLECMVPKPPDTIPPADLPVCSSVAPSLRPSTAPLLHDGPLEIHNYSVEEYQQLYHEVVDDMVRNVHRRPYRLDLGRVIKQKLWERLDRPLLAETVNGDGLVRVDVSYRVGVYPPLYEVDISGEPWPKNTQKELITR